MKETARFLALQALALSFVAAPGCSTERAPAFHDTIEFGQETLTKASTWTHGGLAGIVYVPAGQKLPEASLQVGVIISTEHTTASALHAWVREQSVRSGDFQAHDSGTSEESCHVGANIGVKTRTYITLQVCKTGVARAVCVEADETLPEGVFSTCVNSAACFEDVCDARWLVRREALDLLAADVSTIR
jgi:hypothetical protein